MGDAHGDFDFWIILALSSPLIESATFSLNCGGSFRTRCATDFASPTSMSQTTPTAAGGKAFPLPINHFHRLQMIWRSRVSCPAASSGGSPVGIPTFKSSIFTSAVSERSDSTAISDSRSSAKRSDPS
ncbi:hypothetical protein PF001_g31173 [Phytophthora fragariae]|uniref:Uncharacterized protein n=1 Tax=Phytophthora fragariae TaxID=53985 RepID=A0A6A4B098_9STRA|nr:hypothetical protein PF001_g31173 [Phytophthora fragariae]